MDGLRIFILFWLIKNPLKSNEIARSVFIRDLDHYHFVEAEGFYKRSCCVVEPRSKLTCGPIPDLPFHQSRFKPRLNRRQSFLTQNLCCSWRHDAVSYQRFFGERISVCFSIESCFDVEEFLRFFAGIDWGFLFGQKCYTFLFCFCIWFSKMWYMIEP